MITKKNTAKKSHENIHNSKKTSDKMRRTTQHNCGSEDFYNSQLRNELLTHSTLLNISWQIWKTATWNSYSSLL